MAKSEWFIDFVYFSHENSVFEFKVIDKKQDTCSDDIIYELDPVYIYEIDELGRQEDINLISSMDIVLFTQYCLKNNVPFKRTDQFTILVSVKIIAQQAIATNIRYAEKKCQQYSITNKKKENELHYETDAIERKYPTGKNRNGCSGDSSPNSSRYIGYQTGTFKNEECIPSRTLSGKPIIVGFQ